MELDTIKSQETWTDINTQECDDASLYDFCSWAEANWFADVHVLDMHIFLCACSDWSNKLKL